MYWRNLACMTLALCALVAAHASAEDVYKFPEPDAVLDTLVKGHPRLMLTDAELARLKTLSQTDAELKRWLAAAVERADAYLEIPERDSRERMTRGRSECLRRMYALGLAYRLTGEAKYAVRAKIDLLDVCARADWKPEHFLDTAEVSHGVGIGYDWFYHTLDEETRKTIREALIQKGLRMGLINYGLIPMEDKPDWWGWWETNTWNWNVVCNSGLLIGALAIAETDPEWAKPVINKAIRALPNGLSSFAPDGAWGEGPGYWSFAANYAAYGLTALDTALGTDFGLSNAPGLDQAGYFPIYVAGATGKYFNFSDCGEGRGPGNMPVYFWLAKRYGNECFSAFQRAKAERAAGTPHNIIWYVPKSEDKPLALPLDKLFRRGPVGVAAFRSAWNDRNALFVAMKLGKNLMGHNQLDSGTFVMEALGVRWARDLGSSGYGLPGAFDGKNDDGKRWTYFRPSTRSHNLPFIDNKNQTVLAETTWVDFQSTPSYAFAVGDLTTAYTNADSVKRGIAVLERRRVLIQDEIDLKERSEVAWGITTDADIKIDGKTATLTENGKTCHVTILSPNDTTFVVESAEQEPPQARNTGVKRLMIRMKGRLGNVRIAVLMSPRWDNRSVKVPEVKPLVDW